MMNENRKPFVVLEHFDFDSASDVKLFNSRNDDHKLYVNMNPNCESVSDEDPREKKFYLKKSSQKVVRSVSPANVSKRVSFSNRARVLYFSEDANALCSSEIFDNVVHTSEQPLVEPPSDTESKHPEIAPENKHFHVLEKDAVIVLERLPVDLMKQVYENCDHRQCVQTATQLSDSQNFNESSDLQSAESQVSELTESSENILSDDKQKVKTDLSEFETSTDFSSELNVPFHQELKVSIQRLPDHLLEPYLNNNSFKSSEENLNSTKQEDIDEDDVSLPETEVNFKLNDPSLLQHPALNTDVDSSHFIPSESLKQESCQHENGVCNCDVSIRNPCVLNEALNGSVNSSISTPSEPLKQESCEHEDNVYNSDVSITNPCVLTESLNGEGDSSYSTPSEPLKQESSEHENNLCNSDVSIRNPCILNEALNGDVNSSCTTPSEPLKQESSEHENNIYNCDVSIKNPYVLIERLNLIVPEIDSIQHTKKSQKRKKNKKDIFCDEQEDISGNLMETGSKIVLDSTNKPLIGSSKLSKASEKKKKKSKSHLQRNKTSMPLENIHFPSQKVTKILVDSHNLNCTTNVVKQCDLSLTKTKVLSESDINLEHTDSPLLLQTSEKYSSTNHQNTISDNSSSEDDIALSLISKPDDVEHPSVSLSVYNQEKSICPLKNSSSIEQASGISNLNVSNMSTSTENQCHMSNFSSSEDEMPLSLIQKWNIVKSTKTSGHIKKKKRRSEESKTNGMQQFTDFNVMHVAEMTPPNSLTFMSDFKKKVQKTPSTKKIKRKKLSEKEMLLFSHLNDMDNAKQTKILDRIEKKKKRSQKSKTSGMQKFTDFNVMHVAEITPPNSLSFTSNFKKKVKKTSSMKKIERKELSEKEMLLLSHLNSMDNVKQTKILNYIEKKKKRSQKSKTNGVQKFTDFNVMNIAEVPPPNSLTFTSDFKKKAKNTPSKKKIKRKKSSKNELLFSRLSDVNPFLAQVKESNLKKPIKSGAKECDNKFVLLSKPKQTKLNYVNGPTLVSHEDQASNCKNNSALHVKNISQSCYYETIESDADSDISPPLKEMKLDNYNSSCNLYKANKKKSIAVPAKNNVTVTKKSRKKKDCQSKKKGTELHIALRNYLNKFFTEFDSLGVSKKKGVGFSQEENEFVKKKENIYKMLIREMHHHLKNTCSIKKSFKSQRLKEKLKRSLVQIPHIKVELEDDFSSQPPESKENSQKRKGNKENHIDKFRLGFLTGDKFLALYNKCVAAERLILKKYKMKKQQKKKIKRFFRTLKKNSLRRN